MEDLHDQVAGYVLGALDEDERRAFETHLEECADCRVQVDALGGAAAALAYGVEGPAPPAELRDRILVRARGERPNVVPLRPRRNLTAWATAAAAAAACAAIGLGVWAATLNGSLGRERSAASAQRAALALLADPAARRIPLSGARGTLAVGPNGDAAFAVARLEPAGSGKTYEAWVIPGGGAPQPAGLFQVRGGATAVAIARRVPPGATVAVTRERAGGVDAPTTKPLFTATV
jgi:anti-sigma-K factor RskA